MHLNCDFVKMVTSSFSVACNYCVMKKKKSLTESNLMFFGLRRGTGLCISGVSLKLFNFKEDDVPVQGEPCLHPGQLGPAEPWYWEKAGTLDGWILVDANANTVRRLYS